MARRVATAVAVGTATVSSDSCASGALAYSFSDGSGRSGSIALTRLTQNVTCQVTAARPTDPDFAYSGNWFTPATPGQGVTRRFGAALVHRPGVVRGRREDRQRAAT